jgi:acetoacetyl-CoA synthetase
MGTAEIYRVVEALPAVADSLVVEDARDGTSARLLLFVVPAEGREVDDALVAEIEAALRSQVSPRHVPDEVIQIDEVPRTLNGKKI